MKRYIVILLVLSFSLNATFAGREEINPIPLLIIEGLGNGYSAPVITSDRIFVTGEKGGTGFLFAYDLTGYLRWETQYGQEWAANFPGSRASPVIIDSLIYTSSGLGDIACLEAHSGEKKWSVNMIREMHGVNAVFGYSIPVVIKDEKLYCQPGGPDTNIVCLDRHSGTIIWVSEGNGEAPGYATPIYIRLRERNLLVTFSEMAMLGLDAETGELLWTYELSIKGDAPCNKPVYSAGYLYIVEGKGNGAVKFELSKDGSQIKKIWGNFNFDTYFGGFVKTGQFLYGASDSKRLWLSIDTETGKIADSLPFYTGATVSAGENLVLFNQSGKVGLVRLDRGKMILERTYKITKGTGEHFAHPVVAGNHLFIRHGDALLVYDYQELINQ